MRATPEQIRAVDLAKIERARAMTFEQRFLAGADLFEYACSVAKDGIRMQFPSASDAEVDQILNERLQRARRLEQSS